MKILKLKWFVIIFLFCILTVGSYHPYNYTLDNSGLYNYKGRSVGLGLVWGHKDKLIRPDTKIPANLCIPSSLPPNYNSADY